MQVVKILAQLGVTELRGLFDLSFEIERVLGQLRERRDVESPILLDRRSVERAAPSLGEDKALEFAVPMGMFGEDPLSDREGNRIELENGDIPKRVAIRIKQFVIINSVVFSEDPHAIGPKKSLCRLALDLVAQRLFLPAVAGQVELIREEQAACKHRPYDQHPPHHAVNPDAACFHAGSIPPSRKPTPASIPLRKTSATTNTHQANLFSQLPSAPPPNQHTPRQQKNSTPQQDASPREDAPLPPHPQSRQRDYVIQEDQRN